MEPEPVFCDVIKKQFYEAIGRTGSFFKIGNSSLMLQLPMPDTPRGNNKKKSPPCRWRTTVGQCLIGHFYYGISSLTKY